MNFRKITVKFTDNLFVKRNSQLIYRKILIVYEKNSEYLLSLNKILFKKIKKKNGTTDKLFNFSVWCRISRVFTPFTKH